MNENSNHQLLLDNNPQIAFLVAQKKFALEYEPVKRDGKIKFLFWGPGLDDAIQSFFRNDSIPIQDYLAAFTTIRNIIAAMKESG